MKRRGNKSHKVANVKLRPAAPGASPLTQGGSTCLAQETQESTTTDPCPRPFKGVVLCATGIQDKPTLFKQALELGAVSLSAFTSRVTHLIAADYGGAKYWCAVERQIPVLKPSWISENYHIWLRGDDVDVDESMKAHKLPVFSDVVLSLSETTNTKHRSEVARKLKQNDGLYLENLERPVKITHLLCSSDDETDKMRYARKFNQRGEANIHLVWEEWFWDSLEFGGRFNEADYGVQNPRPQRRELVINESPSPRSAVPESSPNPQQQPPTPGEDEEIACVAHRPAMTVQIWGSLLKSRGYEVMNGKVVKDPSKLKAQNLPSPLPPLSATNGNLDPSPAVDGADVDAPKAKSILSAFKRTNSFAPVDPPLSQKGHASQRVQPFRRTTSVAGAPSPSLFQSQQGILAPVLAPEAGPSTMGPRGIFSGLRFRVLGEARSVSVRSAIEAGGGTWVSDQDMDDDVDYIIVRLVSGSKLYREEPDEFQRTKYRTECWLERCLSDQAVCPYEDHITFFPLSTQLPVPGLEGIIMCFSGLHQDEQHWLMRLLRALGIRLETAFSRRTTHLLCPSGTGPKFEKAREFGIPVVNVEWLAAIARRGSMPPTSEYLVPAGARAVRDNVMGNDSTVVDVKGKGKVVGVDTTDVMMNDITNGRIGQVRPAMKDGNDNSTNGGGAPQTLRRPSEGHNIPASAQRPESPDIGYLSFGQPKGLLAGQCQVQGATCPTTPSHKKTGTQESLVLDKDGLRGDYNSSFHRQSQGGAQPPIPSSKTPSPMKHPQEGSMTSVVSLSPMKIDQALQESVASLLGKRQQGENEGGRQGKRSRPRRRQPMSKEPSASSLNFDIRLGSEPNGSGGFLGEKHQLVGESDVGMGVVDLDDGNAFMDEPGVLQKKGAWVLYEDPGQVDERRRLLRLLKGSGVGEDGDEGEPVASGGVRRSTRLATR